MVGGWSFSSTLSLVVSPSSLERVHHDVLEDGPQREKGAAFVCGADLILLSLILKRALKRSGELLIVSYIVMRRIFTY